MRWQWYSGAGIPTPIADWQFLEGSGTTTADSTGNGNTGTLINTPAWVGGGGLLLAAASSQYVSVGTPSDLNITGQMSVWAKVKPNSFPALGTIFSKGFDSTNEQYSLRFSSATGADFFTYNGTVHGVQQTGLSFSAGTIYTLAGTFSGSVWTLYVNGSSVGTATDSQGPVHTANPVEIGAEDDTGSPFRFFDGTIYRVRVWNTGLTSAQVSSLG